VQALERNHAAGGHGGYSEVALRHRNPGARAGASERVAAMLLVSTLVGPGSGAAMAPVFTFRREQENQRSGFGLRHVQLPQY
jgi:hypothetical protein